MALPEPGPLLAAVPLRLTTEEVRLLWSFVHGAIMSPSMRAWMRASLGFCPRHTWAYAVVEIELWESGIGGRGGHQPFDVTVLYEDLSRRTAARLSSRFGHGWGRRPEGALLPARACYLCTQLAIPAREGLVMGYANSNSVALAGEANLVRHTRRWCSATLDAWAPLACPACLGTPSDDGARLCRLHLAEAIRGGRVDDAALAAAAGGLTGVADRLKALAESMTAAGAPADEATEASWIEALGFFAGWTFPAFLADYHWLGETPS